MGDWKATQVIESQDKPCIFGYLDSIFGEYMGWIFSLAALSPYLHPSRSDTSPLRGNIWQNRDIYKSKNISKSKIFQNVVFSFSFFHTSGRNRVPWSAHLQRTSVNKYFFRMYVNSRKVRICKQPHRSSSIPNRVSAPMHSQSHLYGTCLS